MGGSRGQEIETILANTVKRSEEHTSELQSPCNLVCRLLLEKKKINSQRECASRAKFIRRHPRHDACPVQLTHLTHLPRPISDVNSRPPTSPATQTAADAHDI